ncbi:hypothetical protein [Burkholderia sp. LMG 32019]|uniref:hypothetical protein n=1 Tax=Burkholderia sp. LMG 32019 TaxID=3158173 RepID=UPI003C301C90
MNHNRIHKCVLLVLALAIGRAEATPDAEASIQSTQIHNPFPESAPIHASYAKYIMRLTSDPTFQAFEAQTTRENAMSRGTDLSSNGLKRLDDVSLETRMRIVSKILDEASEAECAALLQGPSSVPGPSAMDKALVKLNETDADFWFSSGGDAVLAALRQDPVPSIKQEDVNEGVSRIKATLPPQEVQKFASALQNPRRVSPSDACWAMRILYREGAALAEPYRAAIARATVSH